MLDKKYPDRDQLISFQALVRALGRALMAELCRQPRKDEHHNMRLPMEAAKTLPCLLGHDKVPEYGIIMYDEGAVQYLKAIPYGVHMMSPHRCHALVKELYIRSLEENCHPGAGYRRCISS